MTQLTAFTHCVFTLRRFTIRLLSVNNGMFLQCTRNLEINLVLWDLRQSQGIAYVQCRRACSPLCALTIHLDNQIKSLSKAIFGTDDIVIKKHRSYFQRTGYFGSVPPCFVPSGRALCPSVVVFVAVLVLCFCYSTGLGWADFQGAQKLLNHWK